MYFANFGENDDGRLQLILGICPNDLRVLMENDGVLDLNKHEDPKDPLPVHMMLLWGNTPKDIKALVDGAIKEAVEELGGKDGEPDL